MAYTVINFRTKVSVKKQVAERARLGVRGVEVYQPGPFGPEVKDGSCTLEGPHYPEPHRWYANCQVKDGFIVPGSVR